MDKYGSELIANEIIEQEINYYHNLKEEYSTLEKIFERILFSMVNRTAFKVKENHVIELIEKLNITELLSIGNDHQLTRDVEQFKDWLYEIDKGLFDKNDKHKPSKSTSSFIKGFTDSVKFISKFMQEGNNFAETMKEWAKNGILYAPFSLAKQYME